MYHGRPTVCIGKADAAVTIGGAGFGKSYKDSQPTSANVSLSPGEEIRTVNDTAGMVWQHK
jgi:hypothetical protein